MILRLWTSVIQLKAGTRPRFNKRVGGQTRRTAPFSALTRRELFLSNLGRTQMTRKFAFGMAAVLAAAFAVAGPAVVGAQQLATPAGPTPADRIRILESLSRGDFASAEKIFASLQAQLAPATAPSEIIGGSV